jgi:hypothetical protein
VFHCEIVAAVLASSRRRLVTGELQVAWKRRLGSKRYEDR